ncbi:NADPH dehydrogenase NamA [Clostridium luticellarii]|jgi:NADPH2 dehydrogenase|uniref:NADPH dehydrogenase n=1 Tax=Clostridium luticellarii TaxID=1691940 RepID=A0A2T0BLR3_9CLOT|nr:NADPH dehydrogenase NamA [Clostridium luticellarii]MCI1945487.1 NADPH dehydrogenase NamA [Clostridium luticellarii]MCI1968820.1 NADPH dehydrogenase NamA [Clostridium luticellarii]PRR84821.1 NADPH dehydrogenase [Clostridium luticellarii]
MKLFESYNVKNMTLKNRIVMPPMCMYQASENGFPTLFHIAHYGNRAVGGVGLIIVESTGVTPEGRITDQDLGIWDDNHIPALKQIVDVCHREGAKIAIQLNHAGRKSTSLSGGLFGPSAIPFSDKDRTPYELTKSQISTIIAAFQKAAERANAAGFDALEIHAAHGYLLHSFLSPLTNRRTDEYGGSLENRVRFLRQVLEAVRKVWPVKKPLWLRVSAHDYADGGINGDMMVRIVNEIGNFIDLVHVSTGGLLPAGVKNYPGYQVGLSKQIRRECKKPTIAVGLITNAEMAENILQDGCADLIAFGRELLRNPYFAIKAAEKYNVSGYIPEPYKRAYPHK